VRVLLTGAFGNIGSHTTSELLRQGHQVRAFDLRKPRTEKVAQRFSGQIEVCWADIRNVDEVRAAVEGVEAIMHLAALIPPASVEQPELAEQVNVGGTRNLIEVAQAQANPPKFLFASSFDLFGYTQDQPPPRDRSGAGHGRLLGAQDCR